MQIPNCFVTLRDIHPPLFGWTKETLLFSISPLPVDHSWKRDTTMIGDETVDEKGRLSFEGGGEGRTEICVTNRGIEDGRAIARMTQLRTLNLAFNHITDMSFVDSLTHLEILHISHNSIASFSKGIPRSLRVLTATSNRIKSLENLRGLTQLEDLWLQKNRIEDLREIRYLRTLVNLKRLVLKPNPICKRCGTAVTYRNFILAVLPQLVSLDGISASHEERERIQIWSKSSYGSKLLSNLSESNLPNSNVISEKPLRNLPRKKIPKPKLKPKPTPKPFPARISKKSRKIREDSRRAGNLGGGGSLKGRRPIKPTEAPNRTSLKSISKLSHESTIKSIQDAVKGLPELSKWKLNSSNNIPRPIKTFNSPSRPRKTSNKTKEGNKKSPRGLPNLIKRPLIHKKPTRNVGSARKVECRVQLPEIRHTRSACLKRRPMLPPTNKTEGDGYRKGGSSNRGGGVTKKTISNDDVLSDPSGFLDSARERINALMKMQAVVSQQMLVAARVKERMQKINQKLAEARALDDPP
ncbi:hypothetical protein AAMO2058_001649600 [Amorphochlora amoebiformis]